MERKVIGKNVRRWDAVAKVTGTAQYTADIPKGPCYYGKVLRATIAHGSVKTFDITEAEKIPGVVKILLPEDMPNIQFPTAGHPYVLDPAKQDIADRLILSRRIRQYGEDIAAVIAETELAAEQAIAKIKVTYEELPFYLTTEESLAPGALAIHDEFPNNVIADTTKQVGDAQKAFASCDYVIEDTYSVPTVQHAHMESQVAYAYQGPDGRWVCVSSTQIPHIARRILGQAFGMPWGRFRVIKPFIGGGFGNKQDVTIEPLVVAMSMAVGGKNVMLTLTREESLANTRVRHAISYKMKVGFNKDGIIKAMDCDAISNNGAYASHGHAIVSKGGGFIIGLYNLENLTYRSRTVYTNIAPGGAMRGYGIPQVVFAVESMVDQIAKKLEMDPIQLRLKNLVEPGCLNPFNKIVQHTNQVEACLTNGKDIFGWDERKKAAALVNGKGDTLRGVGVAAFSYGTGVYPYGEEIAGCRLSLNQDGSVKMFYGATEIGQGSDTVFCQMAAETLGISYEMVYADQVTDTDVSPFDPGTYASRLSYVTGWAVREAAEELRGKILNAAEIFEKVPASSLDIVDAQIVDITTKKIVISLGDLCLKTYYDWDNGSTLTAEKSINLHENSYAMGTCFAEVEVDMKTGKVHLLDLLNMHDSGTILNHNMAEGQVHGGQMMAVGYALGEELLYDQKTGKPLNNNLLDYKFPTIMDLCELKAGFIEEEDPKGPYGNKSLGEPPACAPAAAIRNAVLNATGVGINHLPLSPQRVFESCVATKKGKE